MEEKQNHKEWLKQLTDSIETGIIELSESDKYKTPLLDTRSKVQQFEAFIEAIKRTAPVPLK